MFIIWQMGWVKRIKLNITVVTVNLAVSIKKEILEYV